MLNTTPLFDTTIIENQETVNYDCDKGRIRIVHAWGYNEELRYVIDETGNIWEILGPVSFDEEMLLWIADNNTPKDTTDDILVRVWRRA